MIRIRPRYLAATAAYCATLFLLSSLSKAPEAARGLLDFPGLDKAAHALLYAGLAATVSVGIRRSNEKVGLGLQFWVPLAFASFYGLTDEFHQLFVPQRAFDVFDLLADAAGATIMQLGLRATRWRVLDAKGA